MDTTRDTRRFGARRFAFARRQSIKQYVEGSDGGNENDGTISDKSRRRLSVSGTVTENGEMGHVDSDGEEEEETRPNTNNRTRFKLSKKFLNECNNVDHASVPRKLRSAVKKRSGGSVSPPLPDMKKVKHMVTGNVLPRKNGNKKSKLNMQIGEPEGSPKQVITGPITRDEEEVVETLFALAGMFSNNDKVDESISCELECKSTEAKSSSALATPANEVRKEEGDLQMNHSPSLEGCTLSANEKSREDNSIELDNLETPHVNVARVPEPTGERLTCGFAVPPTSKHYNSSSAAELKLEIAMEPVQPQLKPPAIMKENQNIGSALWPGLSNTGCVDAKNRGPPLNSAAVKLPAWLDYVSSSTQACSSKNVVLTEKDSRVEVDKKNPGKKNEWKRCSAHVYISRLIKVLQITEGREVLPPNCDELKTNEGSKQEAVLANNNVVVIRQKMSSSCSGSLNGNGKSSSSCDGESRSNEVRNATLLHKKLLQDHYQKQSCEFMSVSAGEYGIEAAAAANRLESSTPFDVPYLHSIAQNHATMNHPLSSSFRHHFSAAIAQQQGQQVQVPPYLCSPFSGMESGLVLSEQQQQQQKKKLQRMWTAQQAGAQYRGCDVIDPTHLPSWQIERQAPLLIHYGQPSFPPTVSHSSLQLISTNYATTISPQQQQQHQQFISLLPPNRAKRQHHHHLPSGYQGKDARPVQIILQ